MARIDLNTPIQIGTLRLRNRLYRAPALEGAGQSKSPAKCYAHHFVPNAKAGVGLIIQGTTMVTREGRSSPGMSSFVAREQVLEMTAMTREVHRYGAHLILQLGHAGLYAIETWHQAYVKQRHQPAWAVSPPALLVQLARGFQPVHVLTTAEVHQLADQFGRVAAWAREAGYDGIQLSSGNTKLLHQFLSAQYNRRDDEFGGSLWGRTGFLRRIRAAIAHHAGADYPVLLKYPALETGRRWFLPSGISLQDGIEIAKIAEDHGFAALTPAISDNLPISAFCRGDDPAETFRSPHLRQSLRRAFGRNLWRRRLGFWLSAQQYPFQPLWNRQVFRAVKQAVSIPVFAVGGIRTPQEANEILSQGEADLIGLARPFYAEPDLPRWFLDPAHSQESARCQSCNLCLIPQLLGFPGGCHNPHLPPRKPSPAQLPQVCVEPSSTDEPRQLIRN